MQMLWCLEKITTGFFRYCRVNSRIIFLHRLKNEKDSHFPFTKLRINDTLLSTEFTSRFPNIHNGIFLDVLAQDYTSNNAFLRKIHMKATASSRWLVLISGEALRWMQTADFLSLCANILRKIFPLGFLQKVQNKLISLHKNMKIRNICLTVWEEMFQEELFLLNGLMRRYGLILKMQTAYS